MMPVKAAVVLAVFFFVGVIPTASGQVQDVSDGIQRLLEIADDLGEDMDDLEDDIDDVGDEIDNLEDEIENLGDSIDNVEDDIEDFGEGIEDMETDMETVAEKVGELQEEVKTTRSVLQTGQDNLGQKVTQLVEEVHGNTQSFIEQDIGEKLRVMETSVSGLRSKMDTNTHKLNELQENHVEAKERLTKLETAITKLENGIETLSETLVNSTKNNHRIKEELENLQTSTVETGNNLTSKVCSLEGELAELKHYALVNANHTEEGLGHMREELANIVTTTDGLRNESQENCQRVLKEFAKLQTDTEEHMTSQGEMLEEKVSEIKHYTLALANRTEMELGVIKKEVVSKGTELEGKVNNLEGRICEAIANHTENYREVKEELNSLQRDMNSTLYILQELKNQFITMRQGEHIALHNSLAETCSQLHPTSLSGYYWLRGLSESVYCDMDRNTLRISCSQLNHTSPSGYYWLSGLPERVYCDMDRQSCGCGNPWGWMRVANIDMTDPNHSCPPGFTLRPGTSTRMCEMTSYSPVCTSIVFPTHSVQYSRVCGRVKAYQVGTPDAFHAYYLDRSCTIDDLYLDGVSITHGQSPRKHIWTFAAAFDELRSQEWVCPCSKNDTTFTGAVPPFIGNDYFCDTGRHQAAPLTLYTEDPLWDGEGCGPTNSCCQFSSPPWFCKELPRPITDDIEVRVCRNEIRPNEEIPFEQIELYVQ